MKFRSLGMLAGLACTLLMAGSALAQPSEFVGAEWGVPGRAVDVTSRIRTFIHDGVLQLEVTRFNIGIDPAPHENKVLIIHLRERDGDVKTYSYPERSVARLELHPADVREHREEAERHEEGRERQDDADRREDAERHEDAERRDDDGDRHERGLRILHAEYGAEGQFVNVTDLLRSRVDDGRLFLHVNDFNMGGDPAPGIHKHLRVFYSMHGDRRNIVVDEKTDLRLPQ